VADSGHDDDLRVANARLVVHAARIEFDERPVPVEAGQVVENQVRDSGPARMADQRRAVAQLAVGEPSTVGRRERWYDNAV
jgi:hypothetical protein